MVSALRGLYVCGMTTTFTYELTNTCICENFDEETQESSPSEYCYGCWDDEMTNLSYELADFMENNPDGWWRCDGLPLWNRRVSGVFHADTVESLIDSIGVNSVWTMRLSLDGDVLTVHLSHHDASGTMTVTKTENPDE